MKCTNPFYRWLKSFINKEISVTVVNRSGRTDYDGTLLWMDNKLFLIKERNRAYLLRVDDVERMDAPVESFAVRTKVKIKEVA